MEGYNVTILAYGQTSSGKSYTMGTAATDSIEFEGLVAGKLPDPNTGIIPRAVAQIFESIQTAQKLKAGAVQYTVKASFIEIYNEDLIDLLADAEGDNRPLVQIREDKQGHIFWSGLREVKVKNVAEVMNLLLQGSSVRRTNETDMNAQSSRSHAIFSLTMTQRKYTGSGLPPASSNSSAAVGHRSSLSTSGLPRPASALGRTSTPTGIPGSGRNSVSGASNRPASIMMSPSSAARSASPMITAADGEWTTITSKFHFVDLAGSERVSASRSSARVVFQCF